MWQNPAQYSDLVCSFHPISESRNSLKPQDDFLFIRSQLCLLWDQILALPLISLLTWTQSLLSDSQSSMGGRWGFCYTFMELRGLRVFTHIKHLEWHLIQKSTVYMCLYVLFPYRIWGWPVSSSCQHLTSHQMPVISFLKSKERSLSWERSSNLPR